MWNTGAYDPDANLMYWGTGNPAPDWDGRKRLGDNLYSDSVVALDADTGKLKWHYQFTPHDELDYDSTQVPVLADIEWQGRPRKVMLWANRNGILYVLDRATGEFLLGKPFVKVNWMDGFDAKGRPMRSPGQSADARRHADHADRARRHQLGAAVVQPAHGPVLRRRLGEHRHRGRRRAVSARPQASATARRWARRRSTPNLKKEEEGYGVVRALDPQDARAEVGIQDERHHLGRRAHDGVGSAVQRRQGRIFLRPRRATGELLWKRARRPGQQRPDELRGQRQAVRHGRRRQRTLRVRAAAVCASGTLPPSGGLWRLPWNERRRPTTRRNCSTSSTNTSTATSTAATFLDRAKKFAVGGADRDGALRKPASPTTPGRAGAEGRHADQDRVRDGRSRRRATASIKGYFAQPGQRSGKLPAVLVIHENRGLNPYIEDVARRFAVADFIAFAPDGLTSVGGYPRRRREGRGSSSARSNGPKMTEDFVAAAKWLKARPECNGKVGAVGFCFGGGIVNQLAVRLGPTSRRRAVLRPPAERGGHGEDQGAADAALRRATIDRASAAASRRSRRR